MDAIEVNFSGGKRIEAQVGDFTLQTDQPQKYGGEASAPAPFDLFLGSLATCAGIFAWNFLESRRLSTEGLALKMECIEDEKKKMIGNIIFHLTLPKDFPERYQSGIIRAIELCAVKRHMHTAPDFSIQVK
ncbi:MAG: OsmC family protein [Candidatus Thiodiazotropha lotti]|uniref:OsmC family protein n=1 Tax=Candidatus Thiodiazotropha lotti TaxID=2792787 RepID=A0A9E4K4K2_9GAMM|nr:OsmC family protein [Candidatus Thiodiazotropha lotti]MCG7938580.1 OsmC family protein [Candidatus Thiodiazotropha lotti]MCW4203052.1 OsmC family protein [Candidatus Thiodiazotropha lotti]